MKTVVITGASKGIGKAAAETFLAKGWRVVGTYYETPLSYVHEHLVGVELDQGNPESITRSVERVVSVASRIDALINNAAVLLDASVDGMDMAKVRTTFEVDLFGLIDFTERLIPVLSYGAHIVNMGSTYGSFSFSIDDATSGGYRMAKAALNMYTRELAFRLNSRNIIVSSLDPGWVTTDMGFVVADEKEKPDREPLEAAHDVHHLITTVTESGYFWKFGKKRSW